MTLWGGGVVGCPVSNSFVTGLSHPTRAWVPPCRSDPCCTPSRWQQARADTEPAPIPSERHTRPDFLHTTAKQLTNCHLTPFCNSYFLSCTASHFFQLNKKPTGRFNALKSLMNRLLLPSMRRQLGSCNSTAAFAHVPSQGDRAGSRCSTSR